MVNLIHYPWVYRTNHKLEEELVIKTPLLIGHNMGVFVVMSHLDGLDFNRFWGLWNLSEVATPFPIKRVAV